MTPFATWSWFRRFKSRFWAIKRIIRALRLFIPMTRDVLRGDFRPVPWSAFGMLLLALGYLIMPFDLIPDFLVLIGLVDDVFIVGWLLNRIDQRLEGYRRFRGMDDDYPTSSHSPS